MQSKTINFIFTLVVGWAGIGLEDKFFESKRDGYFFRLRTCGIWDDKHAAKTYINLLRL